MHNTDPWKKNGASIGFPKGAGLCIPFICKRPVNTGSAVQVRQEIQNSLHYDAPGESYIHGLFTIWPKVFTPDHKVVGYPFIISQQEGSGLFSIWEAQNLLCVKLHEQFLYPK